MAAPSAGAAPVRRYKAPGSRRRSPGRQNLEFAGLPPESNSPIHVANHRVVSRLADAIDASDKGLAQIVDESGASWSTVWRIARRITRRPSWGTVLAIAPMVGIEPAALMRDM